MDVREPRVARWLWLVAALVGAGFLGLDAPSTAFTKDRKACDPTGLDPNASSPRPAWEAPFPPAPACADGRPFAPEDSRGAPRRSLEELTRRFAQVVHEYGDPGVSIAILEGGELRWAGGFGLADRERGILADADTQYRVGSISKPVLSLAVLRASEHGLLRLDEPLSALAPDLVYENVFAAEAPITVAHLLEHSSAFDEMRYNDALADPAHPNLELSRVLDLNPRSRVARWRPGRYHAYSQVGYSVAARALESRAAVSWEDFVRREVLEPLGMLEATYRLADAPRLARGYEGSHFQPALPWEIHHRAGGGLSVSARELARMIQMLLARGEVDGARFLSPASIARMERGQTLAHHERGPTYGLGNYPSIHFGRMWNGHGGWMPGYASHFGYDPGSGAGFVVLVNDTGPASTAAWHIAMLIGQWLDAGMPPPPTPPAPVTPAPGELEALAGHYRYDSWSWELTGWLERGSRSRQLFVSEGVAYLNNDWGQVDALEWRGEGRFARTGEPEPSLVVFREGGALRMHDMHAGYRGYVHESGPSHLLRGLFFLSGTFGLLVFAVFSLGWILRRGMYKRPIGAGGRFALLSGWSMFALLFSLLHGAVPQLARPSVASLAVFFFGWTFCVATAAGIIEALRGRFESRAHHVGYALLMTWLGGWMVFLSIQGWIGLRTWLW